MIFDFHTHIYPADANGFWKLPSSVKDLIEAMDAAGVQRAAVIAIAPYISNAVVVEAARAHPDRLVAIGSVEPLGFQVMESLEEAVQRLGVRAIKVHPRLQGFGVEQLSQLMRIAEHCAMLGVPLVICSFEGGRDFFRTRILEMCSRLAEASPKTTLVLAHAGGHRPLETLMVLKAHRNVLVDVSFTPLYFRGSSVVQDLEYLVRKADPHRVLFGSDFPEASMHESVEFTADLLDRLSLGASHVEAVLWGNANQLLGIG